MTIFDPRPALLGHRGLGKGTVDGFGENSLDSFLRAVEIGLPWVEVDVRRTGDDTLVVAHNPAYDDGTFLADLTAAQAKARGTLLLDDLLTALPEHVGVDLDLKLCLEDATRRRAATTAALLAPVAVRESRRRPVFVGSLDAAALATVAELAPGVPRGLLTWIEFPADQGIAAAAHLGVQLLAMNSASLWPNRYAGEEQLRPLAHFIDQAHAAGLEVLAWCPGPQRARELITAGADAICVNDAPRMVAELRPETSGYRLG